MLGLNRTPLRKGIIFLGLLALTGNALASIPQQQVAKKEQLADRLTALRSRVMSLQENLIEGFRTQREARGNLKKIQVLLKLQREERDLGRKRVQELEGTIGELESRRGVLRERILVHERSIRRALRELKESMNEAPATLRLPESERIEAPRRKILANLVDRGLKEIEAYKVDLADADQLQGRIQEEQEQLAYLFQDLKEQESVLELNRQLQVDLLRKKHMERLSQLDRYRKLKNSEAQVQQLISDFNARLELEQTVETERAVSKAMMQGVFGKLKGKLPLPIQGEILSQFGRSFDSKSSLHIFKKGIEISAGKKQPVRAITAGRVAYSGELPNYGRITIIDHGEHFYTLCGHLGELTKRAGDAVASGDPIGTSDDAGTPVYFEIRARNIAVNPLQWVSN